MTTKKAHKLSLLIPVYNEERNIQKFCETLVEVPWGLPCEMIFVDDCSKDHSPQLIQEFIDQNMERLRTKNIEILFEQLPKNAGKGSAIQKAIDLCSGTIAIVQDADFEYDPNEIPQLVNAIVEEKADIVYGSRFKKNALQVHRTYHYFVNRFLTLLSNLLSGLYLTDMETCYKACRTEILKNLVLHSPRFGFEVEFTAHVARLRVRILEYPISYYPRNYLQGKKISWKDGVAALWHILYFNWIVKKEERFTDELPERYRVSGSEWL
ncbi:MAG: glycosyltransferase family 2 protein [Bdellovibrionales bacterium]